MCGWTFFGVGWVRESKSEMALGHSLLISQLKCQEAGLEGEQLELNLTFIWDAGGTGGGLAYYTMLLTPCFFLI